MSLFIKRLQSYHMRVTMEKKVFLSLFILTFSFSSHDSILDFEHFFLVFLCNGYDMKM